MYCLPKKIHNFFKRLHDSRALTAMIKAHGRNVCECVCACVYTYVHVVHVGAFDVCVLVFYWLMVTLINNSFSTLARPP